MERKNLIIIGSVVAVFIVGFILTRPKQSASRPQNFRGTSTTVQAKELYAKAANLKKDHEFLKAKEVYKDILANHPDFDQAEAVQKESESLNLEIIFSNVQTPQTLVHEVAPGDSLVKIAKKYNTTVELLKRSNNLNTDVIRVGEKIRVWTQQFNIFVDKSQNILLLKEGDEVVKVYNVSTGKNNSTPIGTFKITSKIVDPVWFHQGVVVPPESPENVLGTRWMGFDLPGYGIHGTTEPETIGQQVTAGCVRMRNEDVQEVYSLVTTGTEVTITN